MKMSILSGFLLLCLCAPLALADERPDHYQGKPADSVEQALANLDEYNAKLARILEQSQLSGADLADIHQLTYTLENALERLRKESAKMADILEALHLASERGDTEGAGVYGEAYLEKTEQLLP